MIRKAEPCRVCGISTRKLLFGDKTLGVSICSGKCEHQYIQACTLSEEDDMLRCLDQKIETARRNGIIGWATAGAGLLLVALGFFATDALVFFIGIVPMVIGSSSTRVFEERKEKLDKTRKRIRI